jgi:signal transduction histidine kinase
MTQSNCEDILADFGHKLRQPLSTLEALTSYLDLITSPQDQRVRLQLQRMHSEIDDADRILREGLLTLRAYFVAQGRSSPSEMPAIATREEVVDELARPLTKAAMASATN